MLERTVKALILVGAGLLMAPTAEATAQDHKIIVNAANPVGSMSREEVAQAFMKRKGRWDDGTEIAPIDLGADSPVRDSFSTAVHERSPSAVRAFWQQQIFSGRGVPPVEVKTDREVVAFVASKPGAIGYVSAGADLGTECKVLEVGVH